MTEVRKTASVHPKTVTDVSAGAVGADGANRPRAEIVPKAMTTHHIKVHPVVWRTAMNQANYDRHRIQVISETEVVVHNDRSWNK